MLWINSGQESFLLGLSFIVIHICYSIPLFSHHLNQLFLQRSDLKLLHENDLVGFLALFSQVLDLLGLILVVLSSVKWCAFDDLSFGNESALLACLESTLWTSLGEQIRNVFFWVSHWSHWLGSFLLDVHFHHPVLFVHFELHFNNLLLKWYDSLIKKFLPVSEVIKISYELLVLFGSFLNVILCSGFILNCVHFDGCYWSFHVSKLSIKFLNRFRVFLFLLNDLISSWHDIVLVELHQSLNIFLLILGLNYVVYIRYDFEYGLLLIFSLGFLLIKFMVELCDFRVLSLNFFLRSIDFLHLILKHLFKVQDLFFQLLNLLLLWF